MLGELISVKTPPAMYTSGSCDSVMPTFATR